MTRLAPVFAFLAVACAGRSDSGSAAALWRTVFDSTGDTIVARTSGIVPSDAERRLVLEQQIGQAEGSDTATFGRIGYIAVTGDNRLFVFDEQGPSLKLFDSTGKLVRYVGRKGAGPGEFEQVTGMSVLPNGGLALWDASHARVNVYDAAGDFVTQWRVPITGFFTYNGLLTDREGSVLLTLPLSGLRVFGESGYVRFSATGAIRDTITIPRWVDSTPQLLGTNKDGQVHVSMALPFAPTIQDRWSPIAALVSGPSAPYIVYVTHGTGRPLKIERAWTPVATLPQERTEHRARLTWSIRMSLPDWTWPGADIPATKPAYHGFRTAEDGRIWVHLHSVAEPTEEGDA
ncbi:MAG: 6-bladed beta-propeller, partial [Gemmatimonadaceae bacterium]